MPTLANASGNFLLTPNVGILVYTVLLVVAVPCGLLTAAKGRWGWLVAGFFSVGICWIVGARQAARPDSLWARLSAARHAHT